MGVEPSAVDVVRRFYKAVADGDLDAAAACFAEDVIVDAIAAVVSRRPGMGRTERCADHRTLPADPIRLA